MTRKVLVADLLCGAGGSSTGCIQALVALGYAPEDIVLTCVNHWPTAIDTHRRNHPLARHYVQDIATVRPHILVPEGYLDLLMASPTCTHHSVARGGKPTSDQQRSDPWHIVAWLTELRVKRLIIENVWEFTGWGPVDRRTGKPVASRKGEYFRAWIETLKRLGFEPEWRCLNAADYGEATTRKRFILMARSDGRRIAWPTPTHRRRDDAHGDLFGAALPWRPARDVIDWRIKGRSIFARKKSLAPKTLSRIYAGAVKFGWPAPFLVVLRNHMTAQGLDSPMPTIAANGMHIGLAEPVIVRSNMHGRKSPGARSAQDPLPTITTDGGLAFAEPIIINGRKGNQAKDVSTSPIPTLDTKGGVWLAAPFVVQAAHGVDAGDPDPHSRRVKSVDDPLGAVHAGGGSFGVVEPFVLSRHGEGAPRSVEEPTPTQVAKHSHCLISPYYGSGSGDTCSSGDEPLPTVTAKARFGMVVPVTHSDGSSRARDVETDPLPTLTTANRGELAFIAAQFGERDGQAPRVHDLAEPTPTICATGRVNLVEGVDAEGGREFDILFRMLEPHELAAAMGFVGDDAAYEFAGTKTEQIKQIGNAVSVRKMRACVAALMADAAPRPSAPVSR